MARHLNFRLAYPPRRSQPCPGCVDGPPSFAAGQRFAGLGETPSNSPVGFIAAAAFISLGIVFAIRAASKA